MRSGAYALEIKKLAPKIKAVQVSCPLFVPLVEEGWWQRSVTEAVARIYLEPLKKAKVDSLVLGCTHYPVIKDVIGKVMGREVTLIDSGEETAREFQRSLLDLGLRKNGRKGWSRFYVSDDPDRFLNLSRRFLGDSVRRVFKKNFD